MSVNDSTITQQIIQRNDWRQELVETERAAAERLQAAYSRILPRIRQDQQDLADALALEVERGAVITPGLVRGQATYTKLLNTVEVEMNDFSRILSGEMSSLEESSITAGMNGAFSLAEALGGSNASILRAAWIQPNPAAIRNIVNYMDSAGMRTALSQFGDNAARDMSDLVIGLAAQGKNPRFIARMMGDWNSVPYSWADNMARTVTNYGARTASHATYVANEDVLEGWMWVSATDARTCISCWSKHGTVYDLKQILNDHHRGRCTPVPVVKGTTWRNSFMSGPDVFVGRLSPAEQRAIMGNAMHDAWQRNEVSWSDFSVPYENDIYGEMTRAASLKEILKGKA